MNQNNIKPNNRNTKCHWN